jgi:hypothetical protein
MIVRVLSVRIAPGRGPEFHAFIREHGLPRIQAHPGLISVHAGRRTAGNEETAIVVTVWRDWHAIQEALGPDPSLPYLANPDSGLIESTTVEHFEAIEIPGIPPPLADSTVAIEPETHGAPVATPAS